MAKGSIVRTKGVFLNRRRWFIYNYICGSKCRSLEELIELVTNVWSDDLRIKDKPSLRYHLEILKKAGYIVEQDSYGQKIYRKAWFSQMNL